MQGYKNRSLNIQVNIKLWDGITSFVTQSNGCITCLYDSFDQDCPAIILVSQILSCLRFFSLPVEVVYLVVWDLLEPVQVPPPEGEQLLGAEPEPGRDARTPGLQIPQKLLELGQLQDRLSLQSVDQSIYWPGGGLCPPTPCPAPPPGWGRGWAPDSASTWGCSPARAPPTRCCSQPRTGSWQQKSGVKY